MSRRRRRGLRFESDGTELMLDTVANLFGGIVLIALLIAIMSGQQAHRSDTASESTARAVISAAGERVRASRELTEAEATLQDLRALSKSVESGRDPSIDEVVRHLTEALVTERDLLVNDREKLKRIQSMQGDLNRIDLEVDSDVSSLEVEFGDLEAQRERAEAERAPAAQLPIRGQTDRPPLHIVLRWGRLYLLLGPEGQSVAGVERKTVRDYELHFLLKADAGSPIVDGWETQSLWKNVLAAFPPNAYYAQLFVYDDSYREFLSVRRQLLLSGYRYRIDRFMGNQPIILVPGDTGITD